MPDDESWRSHDATAYLDRVQRAGFAWEFLRRNPDYREDYEDMSRDAASGTTIALEAALALAQRWGLSFPVRPPATQRPGTGLVGIQRASGGRDADDGAAGDVHGTVDGADIADLLAGLDLHRAIDLVDIVVARGGQQRQAQREGGEDENRRGTTHGNLRMCG